MKKIEELTQEQERALKPFAQSWIDRLDKGAEVNKPEAKRLIKNLYTFSKLKEPEVLIVNSPLGAQLAPMFIRHGENVRDNVWDNVRENVRANVCANVQENVRENVWDNMGANVWANVRANVRENVRDNVRDNVWDNVRANVWANVRANVCANVWANAQENVRDNVRENVRANVCANVQENVRENVWDNMGENFEYFCSYGSFLQDAAWCSFYNFFEEICGYKISVSGWSDSLDLIKTNICECIQLEGLCIGCEMPMYVKRDEQGRMHNPNGLAIEWADSYGFHCLWGVRFESELFEKLRSKTILPAEIFALKNTEQRMASLKLLGSEFVCNAIDSQEVDKSDRGNRLFSTDKLGTNTIEYFLRYRCPSTNREYVSFVPSEIGEKKDADLAMAWKFGLEKSVYQTMITES